MPKVPEKTDKIGMKTQKKISQAVFSANKGQE